MPLILCVPATHSHSVWNVDDHGVDDRACGCDFLPWGYPCRGLNAAPNTKRIIKEVTRVLKPGGQLIFIERGKNELLVRDWAF